MKTDKLTEFIQEEIQYFFANMNCSNGSLHNAGNILDLRDDIYRCTQKSRGYHYVFFSSFLKEDLKEAIEQVIDSNYQWRDEIPARRLEDQRTGEEIVEEPYVLWKKLRVIGTDAVIGMIREETLLEIREKPCYFQDSYSSRGDQHWFAFMRQTLVAEYKTVDDQRPAPSMSCLMFNDPGQQVLTFMDGLYPKNPQDPPWFFSFGYRLFGPYLIRRTDMPHKGIIRDCRMLPSFRTLVESTMVWRIDNCDNGMRLIPVKKMGTYHVDEEEEGWLEL